MNKTPTYVDGVASSQAIDTAGEIVDLKGLDISSLVGAHLNWEHFKDVPAQVIGKILEAKKIFNKEDCENERHIKYWNKCQIPFLYIKARLLDDKKPSAVEAAALFLDDAEHPNEHPFVGFSVEGARLGEKQGMLVPRSIARKVTVTGANANKTCAAEMIPVHKEPKDDLGSLFKGEMELFSFEPTYEEILEKSDKWSSKLHSTGIDHSHKIHGTVGIKKVPIGGNHQFEVRHNDKLVGMSPDVKHANTAAKKYMGSLNKGETGHEKGIHTQKYGSNKGKGPASPSVGDYPQSAMGAAVRHKPGTTGHTKDMGAVIDEAISKQPKKEVGRVRGELNRMPSPNLPKSERMEGKSLGKNEIPTSENETNEKVPLEKALVDAGKTPHQKAASRTQRNDRTVTSTNTFHPGKVGKFFGKKPDVRTHERSHSAGTPYVSPSLPGHAPQGDAKSTHTRKIVGTPAKSMKKAMDAGSSIAAPSDLTQGAALGKESLERKMHKKEQSKGYKEAEEAYSGWDKREKFRTYMKTRMPHLADGEVDAIGRILAFKQSKDKKKKISSMYAGTAVSSSSGPSGSGTPAQ